MNWLWGFVKAAVIIQLQTRVLYLPDAVVSADAAVVGISPEQARALNTIWATRAIEQVRQLKV